MPYLLTIMRCGLSRRRRSGPVSTIMPLCERYMRQLVTDDDLEGSLHDQRPLRSRTMEPSDAPARMALLALVISHTALNSSTVRRISASRGLWSGPREKLASSGQIAVDRAPE